MYFFSHEPIMQRFVKVNECLTKPMTVADLQKTPDCLVAITYRYNPNRVSVYRWGLKPYWEQDGTITVHQGFWPLDGTQAPNYPWNTYGTDWQCYRIDLPQDASRIAIKAGGKK